MFFAWKEQIIQCSCVAHGCVINTVVFGQQWGSMAKRSNPCILGLRYTGNTIQFFVSFLFYFWYHPFK